MVRFRVFAMYVRTELVHTYIGKRPSFLLYRILPVPKVGTGTSTVWFGIQAVSFIGVFNLNTPTLDKWSNALGGHLLYATARISYIRTQRKRQVLPFSHIKEILCKMMGSVIRRPLFWQGKDVVLHDFHLIRNSGGDFWIGCDQIGHNQFKGVTNGYTL